MIGEVGAGGPCITPAVGDCAAFENAADVGLAETEGDGQEEEVGVAGCGVE